MHHNHEALDREGGTTRAGLLAPLAERDFRLLWAGACASLLGDGAFFVALAWQVYALSGGPAGMSLVGAAMTVPTVVFLVAGGVLSDRADRRLVLVGADLLRACAVALLAVLVLSGHANVAEIAVLAALYGTGTAFHAPAFDALVPEILAGERLAQANALDQLVRPLALRLAGPALGGVLVGFAGAGAVFGLDAASFVVSAATALLVRGRPAAARVGAGGRRSARADLVEGWRFVRGRAWLWATFASAAVAYLLFMGPVEVLVPFVVKDTLHGSATDLGLVFAAGGLSSMLCATVMGRRRLPRRAMTFTLLVWTAGTLSLVGYGAAGAIWQLMVVSAVFNGLETVGTIVWATLKQREVPSALLGRVSSIDWLISIGLLPLSFALTAPISAAIGARATLVGAGILGAVVTYAALHVPGTRALDGADREAQAPWAPGLPDRA